MMFFSLPSELNESAMKGRKSAKEEKHPELQWIKHVWLGDPPPFHTYPKCAKVETPVDRLEGFHGGDMWW